MVYLCVFAGRVLLSICEWIIYDIPILCQLLRYLTWTQKIMFAVTVSVIAI